VSAEKYETSLYVAHLPSDYVPYRVDVRNALWDYFGQLARNGQVQLIEEEKGQTINFNRTLIYFRVKDVPADGIYLLAFLPTGKDTPKWRKTDNQNASRNVLDFCDLLGPKIAIEVQGGVFTFKRASYSGNVIIDISDWEVECPYKHPATKEPLRDFILKTGSTNYEHVYQCVPKDSVFHVFTDTYIEGGDPLAHLKSVLRDYGKISLPKSLQIAKEFGEKLDKKQGCVFIFLETPQLLQQWYKQLKLFFDSNEIPTQYVNDATITNKMRFPGVKANLLLEMLTKMGRPPIVLQAPEEIFVNDGFLCLSDIPTVQKKLFGALFTYSRQGLNVKGEVQIYEDIEYETTEESIEMPEGSVDLLAKKAVALFGSRPLKIDILLTRAWKQENVSRLVTSLRKNKVEVERVYHLSSRTCRFVDEYLESNVRSLSHPYIILGSKIGFLRTSTDIRFYPHLFSYYVELVYPEDKKLQQEDLEKILWLVKRRIYRVQEFHVLKKVEPVYIFSSVRKMYIGEIKERLAIPLRLLI